ncbi:unnamed protein product [Parnassius apollo]|uniref:(apollo) hypothetical protein n=1 Tax=Parnassius apollo TaxID=110799 RepID=A0A8S3WRG3_PARAO|nr:unnamed protein product [Parnassius apollo]
MADLAPSAQPYFRHRAFFHSPQGQEMYALQRSATGESLALPAAVGRPGAQSTALLPTPLLLPLAAGLGDVRAAALRHG